MTTTGMTTETRTQYEISPQLREEQPTAVAEATLATSEVAGWLDQAYGAVMDALRAQGLKPNGPPFARYRLLGRGQVVVEAGFPVPVPVTDGDEVHGSSLPGGPVARTVHVGGPDRIAEAYEALATWVAEHGGALTDESWEVYVSLPDDPDPRTEVVQAYAAPA